jgi:hypothetical protein
VVSGSDRRNTPTELQPKNPDCWKVASGSDRPLKNLPPFPLLALNRRIKKSLKPVQQFAIGNP